MSRCCPNEPEPLSCSRRGFGVRVLTAAATLHAVQAHASGDGPLGGGAVLRDQEDRRFALSRLRGRTVLLSFVYTGCSSLCPLLTRQLVQAQRSLAPGARAQVRFLSVSVDPLNDTPAALKQFALAMGADLSGWTFATGSHAEIERLTQRLQVFDPRRANPGPADHAGNVYLIDRHGRLMQRYAAATLDSARIARETEQLALTAS